MSTAPGWYPDPHDRSKARYWDGQAWSDQTQALEALGGQAPDPEPPPAAPTAPARPPATPPPASPPPAATPPPAPPPPAPPPSRGGGGGSGPGGPSSGGPGGSGWRRPWAWAAALAIVAMVVAGVAVFTLTGEAGAEVTLEPTGSTGPDPFTDSLAYAAIEDQGSAALGEIEDPRTEGVETALAGQVVAGTAPAVYGGSRDTRVCDVRELIRFLEDPANAEKAEAWAGAAGIGVEEISRYVRGLTAVQLSFATRVTNHGFSDGEANSFQAVLEGGTAVLVDDTGAPRVKCNCGNPLLEPADLGGDEGGALDLESHARNPDDAWDGLDPAQVVSIRPGQEPVEEITLNDLDGDGLLQRPVGSDGASERDTGTGDVRVKLEWSSDADLDLHVTEPSGTEIWYQATGPTATGGQLDVDSNVNCANNGSVENVFWPAGEGPSGTYEIEVVGFKVTGCGVGDFTVTVDVAGQDSKVHTGSVGEGESARFTFTVGSADSEG